MHGALTACKQEAAMDEAKKKKAAGQLIRAKYGQTRWKTELEIYKRL